MARVTALVTPLAAGDQLSVVETVRALADAVTRLRAENKQKTVRHRGVRAGFCRRSFVGVYECLLVSELFHGLPKRAIWSLCRLLTLDPGYH